MYDVFISYAHRDMDEVKALQAQLQAAGLKVWRDENQIETFEAFTSAISKNLIRCKVLLAWYSQTYPLRPYCQWELATAHCADPERVLVINPHEKDDHIWPQSLRPRKYGRANDPETCAAIVARVKALSGPLPLSSFPDAKRWVGIQHNGGSNRFVGRMRELWQIDDSLQYQPVTISAPGKIAPSAAADTAQIQGLGGMGKTMLAEEYARRFAARWPGGVYRGIAANGAPVASFHREVVEYLRGSAAAETCKTDADALRMVRDVLPTEPYLWLVDNLPEGITAEQAQCWLAPTAQGRTLITTRNQKIDTLGKLLPLDCLDPAEALDLLTRGHKTEGDERTAAEAICIALLGGHAMAVDVAGALVPEVYPTYAQLHLALRDQDAATLADVDELGLVLPTGHEPSILRTFEISLNQLRGSKALQVLRFAALLAPNQPIPRLLLEASLPDQPPKTVGLALKKLCSSSLCRRDSLENMILHSVLGIVVRGYYGSDGETDHLAPLTARAQLAFISLVSKTVEKTPRDCLPLIPHGTHLADKGEEVIQGRVLTCLWHSHQRNGFYAAAKKVGEEELSLHRRVLGPEHPDTLTSMSNLAITLWSQGDLEGAKTLQEETLSLRRRVLGPEHPDTLTSMNNLASTLQAQGDLEGARTLQEEVLSLRRRVLGPEHPDTLSSMRNLASTLWSQGDIEGAKTLEEETLSLRRRVLGPEHSDTLSSMSNLASTLWAQGDLEGAKTLQEEVLSLRRRVLGPEHPETLISMSNLASTLWAQGDLEGARTLEEETLSLRRRVLGPEHPHTLSSMGNLAITLSAQGDLEGAENLFRQAHPLLVKKLGPNHPQTQAVAAFLAHVVAHSAQVQAFPARFLWAALRTAFLSVVRRVCRVCRLS